MKKEIGIALTKKLCPVCCKEMDGEIIMNSQLSEKNANEIEKLHNQVIGFSKELCKECKTSITENGVFLVSIIEEKTDNITNPYREGSIIGITKDAFYRIFESNVPKNQWCYISSETFDNLFKNEI